MFPSQRSMEKHFIVPSPVADSAAHTGVGLYARFAFAGAIFCAVTHGAM